MGYNPQESLENTIKTMGTLLGVHPIVPWSYTATRRRRLPAATPGMWVRRCIASMMSVRWTAWQLVCWDSYCVYVVWAHRMPPMVSKIYQERSFFMKIFGDHEIPGLQFCYHFINIHWSIFLCQPYQESSPLSILPTTNPSYNRAISAHGVTTWTTLTSWWAVSWTHGSSMNPMQRWRDWMNRCRLKRKYS